METLLKGVNTCSVKNYNTHLDTPVTLPQILHIGNLEGDFSRDRKCEVEPKGTRVVGNIAM